MDKESEVELETLSGTKDLGEKYARLLDKKDIITTFAIFSNKVTKGRHL